MTRRLFILILCLFTAPLAVAVPVYPVELVSKFAHDPTAFTQGLVWHEGRLFESTGLYGRSTLREVALETGQVLRSIALDRREFGEGLTVFGGRLIQLTWLNRRGYVYDVDDFEPVRRFRYEGEGWGLTHDGTQLIMSDGTAELRFLNPDDFSESRRVTVTAQGAPQEHLNELQYINGRVYANLWMTPRIAVINPADGVVEAFLDLTPLFAHLGITPRMEVETPNGIAFDPAGQRLFVTGKLWPWLFEIGLLP